MIEPFKAGPDPRLPERHGSKSIEALKAVLAAETSHLRLWEHIWHAPPASPFALILEDDARIPSKLEQRLEWLHKIPYDADMVMLGYYLMCYTDGNLTHPCKKGSEDYKDFVRIQKAVDMAGVQKALVRGPTRICGCSRIPGEGDEHPSASPTCAAYSRSGPGQLFRSVEDDGHRLCNGL